ncbi:MAG: amidophosphoribosyltransferase [Verrucomicrobia bacterium]|jgi:amidophosphoribosyltransferase|nr:amidophosphoribosyltransferase [Verrucomicrobiota bacterium]
MSAFSSSKPVVDDRPREFCGLFGVYGIPEAGSMIYQGLFSLQHRGQEGAGIAVADGETVSSAKGQGLVSEVFAGKDWSTLPGHLGVGHVRYSTTGSTRIQNVQPLVVECVDGIWAVAHNGNLVNAERLRLMYQEAGAIFQTSTDSEVLVHLLADPMFRKRPRRVARALAELEGSFCFLLMTRNCLMAARDPHGFRPLSIGKLGDAYIVASETCALDQVGATFLRDVEPGELIIIDETGMHSSMYAEVKDESDHARCIFEMVYFARPDSRVFGENVHLARVAYGKRLAEEYPVEADIVISVPDSGNSAALGYSIGSGIPLEHGFIRNHYIGRTFIMPQQDDRSAGVDMKLAVLPEAVRGKRVVVVDDSIVRGTTARRRVMRLRDAGAKEVHVRISCPPIRNPCFYGIDFPTSDELVAGGMEVEQIRDYIGADTLGYLSLEGLFAPFGEKCGFCDACFTGKYPTDITGISGKHALEKESELDLEL